MKVKDIFVSLMILEVILLLSTNAMAFGFSPRKNLSASTEQGRRVDESAKSTLTLPPGFIALSESKMTWAGAKAWCQKQGGRLPRIKNSDSWDGQEPNYSFTGAAARGLFDWHMEEIVRGNVLINVDGFGKLVAPWPAGLPEGKYWTDTTYPVHTAPPPNAEKWVIEKSGEFVSISAAFAVYQTRRGSALFADPNAYAVCVP